MYTDLLECILTIDLEERKEGRHSCMQTLGSVGVGVLGLLAALYGECGRRAVVAPEDLHAWLLSRAGEFCGGLCGR